MKKIVKEFVKKLGGKTAYSGKTRTMYIDDPHPDGFMIELLLIRYFGYCLPFSLDSINYVTN